MTSRPAGNAVSRSYRCRTLAGNRKGTGSSSGSAPAMSADGSPATKSPNPRRVGGRVVTADAGDGQHVAAPLGDGQDPGARVGRRARGEDHLVAVHRAGPQPVGLGRVTQ